MIHITLPEKVAFIIDNLIAHGYEAYAVGGCVRDIYLGREPGDWDITTSAKPEAVKELFQRTVDTGILHGTVTIMIDKEGFEVTTYRIDGEYEDSRHPKNVEFTCNLKEDLARRDFTINAMAYNSQKGLVDVFDGILDIKRKLIRCVGNPEKRFEEDALRMLRAVRFAGQLGFEIDKATREAMLIKAPTLANISAERVRVELNKLLLSKQPKLFVEASKTGMCKVVFPEFDAMLEQEQNNPHHIFSVGLHVLKAVEELNFYWDAHGMEEERHHSMLCWTMLLHDVAKPRCHTVGTDEVDHFYGHSEVSAIMAKTILKRLKFDNYTIDLAVRLIQWHDYRFTLEETKIRKAASKIGPDIMEDLFLVQRMDILAKNPDYKKEKLEKLEAIMEIYKSILAKKQCLTLKELAVNGKDLMEKVGLPAGPKIGETLYALLDYVLEHPEENKKEALLDKLCKLQK